MGKCPFWHLIIPQGTCCLAILTSRKELNINTVLDGPLSSTLELQINSMPLTDATTFVQRRLNTTVEYAATIAQFS